MRQGYPPSTDSSSRLKAFKLFWPYDWQQRQKAEDLFQWHQQQVQEHVHRGWGFPQHDTSLMKAVCMFSTWTVIMWLSITVSDKVFTFYSKFKGHFQQGPSVVLVLVHWLKDTLTAVDILQVASEKKKKSPLEPTNVHVSIWRWAGSRFYWMF